MGKSENEYEIVGEVEGAEANPRRGRYSSLTSCLGGGVRAMRESMLRELRRDLARLLMTTSGGSKAAEEKRSVSVRPGLALGVITLQAGATAGEPKIILN